jgi:hypothetical protein
MIPVESTNTLRAGICAAVSAISAILAAASAPAWPVHALAYLEFITTPRSRPGRSRSKAWS